MNSSMGSPTEPLHTEKSGFVAWCNRYLEEIVVLGTLLTMLVGCVIVITFVAAPETSAKEVFTILGCEVFACIITVSITMVYMNISFAKRIPLAVSLLIILWSLWSLLFVDNHNDAPKYMAWLGASFALTGIWATYTTIIRALKAQGQIRQKESR